MSSISYTSVATRMYFFPSAIYTPATPFKRGPMKLPRTGASEGAKKPPHTCTKISLKLLSDSRVLESYRDFCWFFVFCRLLTLIFLLMILMVHSQIGLIAFGFKCFRNSSFCALKEQCLAINIDRFFLMFLLMLQYHSSITNDSFSPSVCYIYVLWIL